MFRNTFYRNIHARDLLDIFLVSAISSLLLVRFYLHLTGYPQIGGGSLHIAHMLYGGIFMLIAIVITLTFLGVHSRQVAAVVGGIGFGIFIDELGKFITEDNNYFFRPAVGLIYAIFVFLYLVFNFLTRTQRLSSREYQLNTFAELEEAIAHNMDRVEKERLYDLLDSSDSNSPITQQLRKFVDALDVSPSEKPGKLTKFLKRLDRSYKNFWRKKNSNTLIGLLFAVEVVLLAVGVIYAVYENIDDVKQLFSGVATYGEELIIGQVVSSIVAGGFALYGLTRLKVSRLQAFEYFRRSALVNIYLTQFFIFVRVQFEALPGLIFNLLLLILISYVLAQEARLGKRYAKNR